MDEPLECSMVSVLPGVDFFWKGRLMVNTLVLEPNAPSIDMVSHEGWDGTRLLLVVLVVLRAVDALDPF